LRSVASEAGPGPASSFAARQRPQMPSAPGRVCAAYGVRPPRGTPADRGKPSVSLPEIAFPSLAY